MIVPSFALRPQGPVEVPPPPYFRGIEGTPRNVDFRNATRLHGDRRRGAKGAGIRYEEKAQQHLLASLGSWYLVEPGLIFEDDSGRRTVFPDGVFIHPNFELIVVEVKIRHCADAWWQADQLYAPLLRIWEPTCNRVRCLEVVESFDPSAPFPVEFDVVTDVSSWATARDSAWGVYKWPK